LFITRVTSGDDSDLTSALIRMRSGKIRIERCVMADGAHCAVASRGGDVEMIRCHVRNVPVGVCMLDTNVVMERNHVEGAEVLSLHVENGATASLKDNSFEGRTVLRSCCPDRKSTRLNSSHVKISYAVLCLKKKISIS